MIDGPEALRQAADYFAAVDRKLGQEGVAHVVNFFCDYADRLEGLGN